MSIECYNNVISKARVVVHKNVMVSVQNRPMGGCACVRVHVVFITLWCLYILPCTLGKEYRRFGIISKELYFH